MIEHFSEKKFQHAQETYRIWPLHTSGTVSLLSPTYSSGSRIPGLFSLLCVPDIFNILESLHSHYPNAPSPGFSPSDLTQCVILQEALLYSWPTHSHHECKLGLPSVLPNNLCFTVKVFNL